MPRDPANIGGTPVKVVFMQIENVLGGHGSAEEIPAGGVENSFRLTSRAAGVENVQRIFGVECFRVALSVDIFHFAMPPDIPSFGKGDLIIGPSKHDHFFDLGVIF